MLEVTVLLADNDQDFLEERKDYLEERGYAVITANNPTETKNILEGRDIHVAVLDLRLLDDNDEKDTSGLDIARTTSPSVPKIILTKFPTVQAVKEALGPDLKGLPPAVDFITKQEGPDKMLTAIRKVINLDKKLRKLTDSADKLISQISEDYKQARNQAKWNYRVSLIVSGFGIAIIFLGVSLLMLGKLTGGIPSVVSGIITEAIGVLFFRRADTANNRMDQYHQEILDALHIKWLDDLLFACDELSIEERRENCRERVIDTARDLWSKQLMSPRKKN